MGDVWMVSDDQERWSNGEEFDTREEAIAWGIEEFRAEGCARFWDRVARLRAAGHHQLAEDWERERARG